MSLPTRALESQVFDRQVGIDDYAAFGLQPTLLLVMGLCVEG